MQECASFTHDNLRNNRAIMAELPSSQSNQPAAARRLKAVRLKCSIKISTDTDDSRRLMTDSK